MRCFQRLLGISYRDYVTNEEVRKTISHAIGQYEDLITTVRKGKLIWYERITRSNMICKDNPTVHGTRREKESRQKKR